MAVKLAGPLWEEAKRLAAEDPPFTDEEKRRIRGLIRNSRRARPATREADRAA